MQRSSKVSKFLVTCYATLHPAMSVHRSVGPLFGQRPRRGRSPVKHRGDLYVRTYVHPPSRPILRALSPSGGGGFFGGAKLRSYETLFRRILGAPKHLYNWLCPLVGLSVCNANVGRSTRRTYLAYLALFPNTVRESKNW